MKNARGGVLSTPRILLSQEPQRWNHNVRTESEGDGSGDLAAISSPARKGVFKVMLIRKTSRVLLLDETARTLLFRSLSETSGESFWYPPGGGLEEGEDYEEAARREIFEETGILELGKLTKFGTRLSTFVFNKIPTVFEEVWFYAKVQTQEIDVTGFTEFEKSNVVETKWWTLEELLLATDKLVPTNLPDLLSEYLSSGQITGVRELPI